MSKEYNIKTNIEVFMFLDELSRITDLPLSETLKEYKVVNIAGKAIHVQNYVKLLHYSKEKIVLKIKKNELEIIGDALKIVELGPTDILCKGKIYETKLRFYTPDSKLEESKDNIS